MSSPDTFKNDLPCIRNITDPDSGLTGWLAIDSVINNHCSGGLRMQSDISAVELAQLARIMTLKFGFLGIPHGGAKAGIVCEENENESKKIQLLSAFGSIIREILDSRFYSPWPDLGTSGKDICTVMQSTGLPGYKRTLQKNSSGYYTSLTVLESLKTAASHLGFDLTGSTAAIEGLGKVGAPVMTGLSRLGIKVIAVSTSKGALYSERGLDNNELMKCLTQHKSHLVEYYKNADKISKESLFDLDVDILIPCAKHHSINDQNVSGIKARIICPGANIPITDDAADILIQHGILCIPDFISNCGGVLGGTMEFAGLSRTIIEQFIGTHFSKQVHNLVISCKNSKSLRLAAEEIAMMRFNRIKAIAEKKSAVNKALELALELFRNGLIPRALVRPLAYRYFCSRIQGAD
ncbi:Glu/Leu/Phe/Val dehydrogenase dimerization domain-containing protein [Elusimicrobiota bacterium]